MRLVRRFDGEYSERFERENFAYLSIAAEEFPRASAMFEQPIMDRTYFGRLTDQFRSPHIWKFEGNRWKLRGKVFDESL